MLDYVAIRNWSEPWDDFFHNYYLYRNAAGRWSLVPWDLDREFGENFGWNARKSFFIGERGDPDDRNGEWNRIKDAFIRAYRTELLARMDYLATDDPGSARSRQRACWRPGASGRRSTPPPPSSTPTDWSASPVTSLCNFDAERTSMQLFGDERHSALAGPDRLRQPQLRPQGRILQRPQLQRRRPAADPHRSGGLLRLGHRRPGLGHAHRQLPDPLDRHGHPGVHRDATGSTRSRTTACGCGSTTSR